MTLLEKKAVAEAWAQANKGDDQFKVILFLGGTCLEDAKELARHASAIGLNGISLTAPNYFKPATLHQLAACCIDVADAAPDQPFYYYHIPVLTGVRYPMIELMKLLHGKLKNFAGIKFTDEDIADYTQCIQFENRKYEILWGRDECLLAAMAVGGRSGIGSTYNYAMPLYQKLIAAYDGGDMKASVFYQNQSIEMIALLGKYGGMPTGKNFMKAVGIDCGKFRLPFSNMTDDQYLLFQDDLNRIGFDGLKSI
jgi:N-acetylneuraminate lyase